MVTSLAAGGAAHHVRLLARSLPYDCEVVSLTGAGPVAAAIRAGGTTVHDLRSGDGGPVPAAVRLRRLIRHGRFDLVHTHLHRACVTGRIAARLAGVRPVVATEHSLRDGVVEGRRMSAADRAWYLAGERLGRHTIAASPAIADGLRAWGVPASRISVVPPAIDAGEFRFDPGLRAATRARLGIPPHVPVVGAVGRLEPDRRFDRLVRAVAEAPGATLLLVGDGSGRAALQRLAEIEGVAGRVVFAGAVGHAREMLCAMDVFASPTARETSGLVVLEALAAGLPTLYAACPPLDGTASVRGAVPGARRLSPLDPESLPRALRAELLVVQERRRARLAARSAGGRYDVAQLADAVGEVYERVLRR